jgi:hypothetical protein
LPNLVLYFLPFFNFGLLFLNISTLTTGKFDIITRTYAEGGGFPWTQLYQSIPADLLPIYNDNTSPQVPPPGTQFYGLLFNIVFYGVLAWYLDQVIPTEYGFRQPPWFFLTTKYWGFESFHSIESKWKWLKSLSQESPPLPAALDLNVASERDAALSTGNILLIRLLACCQDCASAKAVSKFLGGTCKNCCL